MSVGSAVHRKASHADAHTPRHQEKVGEGAAGRLRGRRTPEIDCRQPRPRRVGRDLRDGELAQGSVGRGRRGVPVVQGTDVGEDGRPGEESREQHRAAESARGDAALCQQVETFYGEVSVSALSTPSCIVVP